MTHWRALGWAIIGAGLLLIVAIIAYGSITTPILRLPTPTPGLVIGPTPDQVVTVRGDKNILTDPIPINPGAYQIQWEILNPALTPCATRMTLYHTEAPDLPALTVIDQTVPAAQDTRGTITWTVTNRGSYRIQVLSRCGWTLQIGVQ